MVRTVPSIASCLQHTFDATVHLLEDYIPDELSMFGTLLHPLKRLSSCQFISAFGHAPDNYSNSSGDKTNGEIRGRYSQSLLAASASSSRTLSQLKGLEVHARELCKIWTEHITSGFRLSHFEWYREKIGARHEFLIFSLESAGTGKSLWLRVERRPTEDLRRKRDALTRLVGWHEANDIVTISHQKTNLLRQEGVEPELQTSEPLGEKVSLAYLVNVLKIIHNESYAYHLAGANCWFFASTIAEIALRRARDDWKSESLGRCDHRKSKDWVNGAQYRQIMERVEQL